jgi:hypothetical protein
LFDFGAAAGCSVTKAEVSFLIEEEHQGEEHAAGTAGAAEDDHDHDAGLITNHTGFEAIYELACANTGAIRELRLGFLDQFPNAMVVDVQLVTSRGQTTFDVERPTQTVSLQGLI